MAGHSQFKNIMHRKGRQDEKRAKVFTKVGREIMVAAKLGGGNPEFNPRLRAALIEARANNMPNDRVKHAIDKALGAGADAAQFVETRYEGFGPGGVAVIVDCLTDNRTRTAPEIRQIFTKRGGNMGESMIIYPVSKIKDDAMFEAAIEAGADNVESGDDVHSVTCKPDDFSSVRDALEAKLGPADKASLAWQPNISVDIDDEDVAESILELIDGLEDNDDVQVVTANYNFSETILKKFAS
jgi:YebC/PmpR family DNA-binding regulatory protein